MGSVLVLATAASILALVFAPGVDLAATRPVASPRLLSVWVTDGPVFAVAATGGVVYIGGDFELLAPYTGSWVALRADGRADRSWPQVDGAVSAAAADGRGGWFIGGAFTKVGGLPRRYLAHVNADRSVDRRWAPAIGSDAMYEPISALVRQGSTLFVGGEFVRVGGEARQNLAALDTKTGAVAAWNPRPDRSVSAFAVRGHTLYVAGYFGRIAGKPRRYLAAVDTATGAASAWNPNPRGNTAVVDAIALSKSVLYVAGGFERIGGKSRDSLAALSLRSGRATGWNPNPDLAPQAAHGSTVYVGGAFNRVGGQSRSGLAALDAGTGAARSWDPCRGGCGRVVQALAVSADGSRVYAARASPGRVSTFDAATGAEHASVTVNDDVNVIESADSTVFLGGRFTGIGGVERAGLAAVDIDAGMPTPWNPSPDGLVRALSVCDGSVYAGGGFTTIAGATRPRVAALEAATGAVRPWHASASGSIYTLVCRGSTLYAGAFGHLHAFDTKSGREIWNVGADSHVRALAVNGSSVFAGGGFSRIGDQGHVNLAALDADTGAVRNWRANASGNVIYAVAPKANVVYAGGILDGDDVRVFDAQTGAQRAWPARVGGTVHALAIDGRTVYVGGYSLTLAGQKRPGLVALDAATATASSWSAPIDGIVWTLSLRGRTLIAGGSFGVAIFQLAGTG